MYWQRILLQLLLLAVILATAGCATQPTVPEMAGKGSAAVGIAVKVIGPLYFPTYNVDVVYSPGRVRTGNHVMRQCIHQITPETAGCTG